MLGSSSGTAQDVPAPMPSTTSTDPPITQFLNDPNRGILPPIVPAPQAPLAANPSASPEAQAKSGSYTNTHQSGKRYHGKGTEAIAATSAKQIAKKNKDPLKSTEHTEAENDREGFKQESKCLKSMAVTKTLKITTTRFSRYKI